MDEAKPPAEEQKPVVADSPAPAQAGGIENQKPGDAPAEASPNPAGTEEEFDAKAAIEGLQQGLEETNSRLSQIWDFLESLEEEEEKEPEHMDEATEAAGKLDDTEKPEDKPPEAPAAESEDIKKPEEKKEEAQHSKELSALKDEIGVLKAKFAKMENSGVRKTVSSSTSAIDPVQAEMAPIFAQLGNISKGGA